MSDESNILGQINATASGGGAPPATPAAPAAGAGESAWSSAIGATVAQAEEQANLAQGAQNVATAGSQMLAAAKSGQFTIEPGYARQLITGLNNEVAKLNQLDRHIGNIGRETKLGETPAAQQVAPFYLNQVATNGPHSFVPNHKLAIQGLTDMVNAIQVAMNNYKQSDDGSANHISQVG